MSKDSHDGQDVALTKRFRISVGVGILAIVTVIVYVGFDRERILEAWHLQRLQSRDEATVTPARPRIRAAGRPNVSGR